LQISPTEHIGLGLHRGSDPDRGAPGRHASVRRWCCYTSREMPADLSDSRSRTHPESGPTDANRCHSLLLAGQAILGPDLHEWLFLRVREIWLRFVVVSDALVPTELHAHCAAYEASIGISPLPSVKPSRDATALDGNHLEPSMSSTALLSSGVSSKRSCRHSPGQPTSTRSLSVASRRSARFSAATCAQQSY
jgi:hypothetical protein